MIEVYAARKNSPIAAQFVEQMEAEGRHARENNAAWFDPKQVDRDAVHVYHDGSVRGIPETYESLGIPCEILPGVEPETAPAPPLKDRSQSGGWRVEETSPGWFKLIGPDGEQFGKSQRSEDDAWALVDEA